MKIVVIGGTGLIGSKVVDKLIQKGHEALAAAPNTGVDTVTGEGLAEALAGAEVVVDVANSPSFEDQAAMDFFQTAGRNLTAAGSRGRREASRRALGRRHRAAAGQRLFPRQAGAGAPDQGLADPLHPHPRHPVLRVHPRYRADRRPRAIPCACRMRCSSRWRRRTSRLRSPKRRSPRRSTGRSRSPAPTPFRIDELVAQGPRLRQGSAQGDRRSEPRPISASSWATESLIPGPDARLGATNFDWWLTHVPPPAAKQYR